MAGFRRRIRPPIGGQSEVSNFVVYGAPALPHSEDFSYFQKNDRAVRQPIGSSLRLNVSRHATLSLLRIRQKIVKVPATYSQLLTVLLIIVPETGAAVHVRTGRVTQVIKDTSHCARNRRSVTSSAGSGLALCPMFKQSPQQLLISITSDQKRIISLVPGVHVRTFSEVYLKMPKMLPRYKWSIQEDVRDIMRLS